MSPYNKSIENTSRRFALLYQMLLTISEGHHTKLGQSIQVFLLFKFNIFCWNNIKWLTLNCMNFWHTIQHEAGNCQAVKCMTTRWVWCTMFWKQISLNTIRRCNMSSKWTYVTSCFLLYPCFSYQPIVFQLWSFWSWFQSEHELVDLATINFNNTFQQLYRKRNKDLKYAFEACISSDTKYILICLALPNHIFSKCF